MTAVTAAPPAIQAQLAQTINVHGPYHHNQNFGGTQSVAAGNQNIAGRDVAVGQADSTAEKVWGCAKRIWSVLARLFGAKL